MAEKYNHNQALKEVADINAGKPEFLMTEEELRQGVLKAMPKSTICPKHKGLMVLFEGIGKSGEPYRAYKCGINGCKEIVWTDREAETINAEVKDIEAMLGIERPANTPAEGLEKKMKYWKDKDNSVQERIQIAQALNLAVEMIPETIKVKLFDDPNLRPKIMDYIKRCQNDFYQKLKNQNNE